MRLLSLELCLFCSLTIAAQSYTGYPMWNPGLPMEKRVNDLISRLTLEEKVKQMLNAAPAVPRLGIPAYDWWNETLHGVARTPYRVTVFPQAIAMAATWDTAALFQMADYAATEGRAIHNKAIAADKTGDRYLGLTYWTPNINIFRDPRWGRGQETYGEDPFLTAMMGRSFVRGLQGNDPKYLKAAACAKHFAVHSGPEPSRHIDNVNPSTYDLWDTYLPAFQELIVNANVAGVMCAYNAVNTQPCCGNDLLMTDILRRQWKFTGYVTSDCWALDDFFKYHKTQPDSVSAAADALIHTTDIECGTSVYYTLVNAVKTGMVKETQIDNSLKRLFLIRYRLGMFDPPAMVKFAQVSSDVLESPAHKAHALALARESIVLLRNENSLLPLSKKIKKIAVIGPNADNKVAVLGNYNGIPSSIITVLEGIRNKLGKNTSVIYDKGVSFTDDSLLLYGDTAPRFTIDDKPGFKAEYFNNKALQGEPITRHENNIDHLWQEGESVIGAITASNFSARFTGTYHADKNGTITFEVDGDDGYRMLIDGKEVINTWTRNRMGARNYQLNIKTGTSYEIVLEYYQAEGKANIRLRTGDFVKSDFDALADRVKDVDAIVFVGGISAQLEGEEMKVDYPGFNGGDRTSIQLPAIQTALLKKLQATGKPVVLVLLTGSAIAMPYESENIPAIVNAWYGGQSAGTAVADVLFGDYNPAGRLPVTFYKSDKDLPAFSDYSMKGRTYRYFAGEPLYPFGYGLSFTRFNYDKLVLPVSIHRGQAVKIIATITNTGNKSGDEVAQLYLAHVSPEHTAPIRALKGFQRIFLKAGETKRIQFTLTPEQLSLVNTSGNSYQPSGNIQISVGGGQPDMKIAATSNVVSRIMQVQ